MPAQIIRLKCQNPFQRHQFTTKQAKSSYHAIFLFTKLLHVNVCWCLWMDKI